MITAATFILQFTFSKKQANSIAEYIETKGNKLDLLNMLTDEEIGNHPEHIAELLEWDVPIYEMMNNWLITSIEYKHISRNAFQATIVFDMQ